jgi:hypothetical protein
MGVGGLSNRIGGYVSLSAYRVTAISTNSNTISAEINHTGAMCTRRGRSGQSRPSRQLPVQQIGATSSMSSAACACLIASSLDGSVLRVRSADRSVGPACQGRWLSTVQCKPQWHSENAALQANLGVTVAQISH